MPSCENHLQLVDQDQITITHLSSEFENHYRWLAIIACYKAIHVAEGMFDLCDNAHSHGHDDRNSRLKSQRYSQTWKHFKKLYNISLVARYINPHRQEDGFNSRPYLNPAEVEEKVLKKWLKNFEDISVAIVRSISPQDTERFSFKRYIPASS